ncbi:MAG: hypothetical protein MJA83_19665 [Gammaproteobacteria bacterium]|nr:hypothetical protein [Gammaproteobacteria bacterium]
MKRLMLFNIFIILIFSGVASADVSENIFRYKVQIYEQESIGGFGVIWLFSDAEDVVGYLHFHRSLTTMPADRVYLDANGIINSHYLSGDFEEFLTLLDKGGRIRLQYYDYGEEVHLLRQNTVS